MQTWRSVFSMEAHNYSCARRGSRRQVRGGEMSTDEGREEPKHEARTGWKLILYYTSTGGLGRNYTSGRVGRCRDVAAVCIQLIETK